LILIMERRCHCYKKKRNGADCFEGPILII
jgi:hypothetical protein